MRRAEAANIRCSVVTTHAADRGPRPCPHRKRDEALTPVQNCLTEGSAPLRWFWGWPQNPSAMGKDEPSSSFCIVPYAPQKLWVIQCLAALTTLQILGVSSLQPSLCKSVVSGPPRGINILEQTFFQSRGIFSTGAKLYAISLTSSSFTPHLSLMMALVQHTGDSILHADENAPELSDYNVVVWWSKYLHNPCALGPTNPHVRTCRT